MLSTGHDPLDDRIYYKETLSLAKLYSPITLVTPDYGSDFMEAPGIKYLPLNNTGSIVSRFLVIPKAIKTVLKINPLVCHFHDYELIFALPVIRLFSRCKVIYDVHEVYPEMVEASTKIPSFLRPFFAKLADILERALSHLCHYIITTDENIADRFRKSHPHISTIFNYPRLSIFVPDENKISQLRNIYKGRTPIICCGGMDENRGIFQMIRAMDILKRQRPDVILLLVGPMSEDIKERAIQEVKERKLRDFVEIIGTVPHMDIVNYIYISKIGLVTNLPTKKFNKNVPIKQFEYMACGIPVVGSNLPPIASYILKAGCGKVYNPTSVDALAQSVMEVLEDEHEWKRMSDAGKKAVQNLWNWDQMEKKLFDIYETLL